MPWGPTGLYFPTVRQTTRGTVYRPYKKKRKPKIAWDFGPKVTGPVTKHVSTGRRAMASLSAVPPGKMVGMGKRSIPTSALSSPMGGPARRAIAAPSGQPIKYRIPASAVRR